MSRKLLVVLVPNGLQLYLFIAVFIDLSFEFAGEAFDRVLQFLHFGLLEVEELALEILRLILLYLVGSHLVDFLAQLLQLRFLKDDLLSAVSLLLLELDGLLRLLLAASRHCHLLQLRGHRLAHHSLHVHLLGHRRGLLEFIVHSLDHLEQGGRLRVPTLDSWTDVFDSDRVEVLVCHKGHHVDLGRHLGKHVRNRNLDEEGCG